MVPRTTTIRLRSVQKFEDKPHLEELDLWNTFICLPQRPRPQHVPEGGGLRRQTLFTINSAFF